MGIPSISPYKMPGIENLPENKVDWKIEPNRAVLLIHDMQKYFLNAYDENQSPIIELKQNIKLLKEECKKRGIPVVYSAQPGNQSPKDRALLTDFWGVGLEDKPEYTDIIEEISPDEGDMVLTKWRYSAFKRTELLEYLQSQGRDQLIICGVYAHIGCLLSACDAFMQDIQPFFVADAVADFSSEFHAMSLNYVSSRCGMTTTASKIVEELKRKEGVAN